MERSESFTERWIWGTWEELLLACAVTRHGTKRWDSVAMEVSSRSPSPHLLTAAICEQRFLDLQRRFEGSHLRPDRGGGDKLSVPWLDELRRLRVAELRREVERHDVSIESLRLKLKSLREERERSTSESKKSIVNADIDGGRRDLVTGGEEKVTGEGSCNGSSDSVAKDVLLDERAAVVGISRAELGAKESSDVQSSAGLSRWRRGSRRKEEEVVAGREGEAVKSRPLGAVLEMIRSHKCGSVFEHRMHSQESARYRSLIRRHMDLSIIQSKIDEDGPYTRLECFRDLLLLCINAFLFFSRTSDEYAAASELHQLVNKEIAVYTDDPLPSWLPFASPRPKLEPASLSSEKLLPLPPLVPCRAATGVETVPAVDKKARGRRTTSTKPRLMVVRISKANENSGLEGEVVGGLPELALEEQKPAEKVVRKRDVVGFLKRMRQTSTSPSGRTRLQVQGSSGRGEGSKAHGLRLPAKQLASPVKRLGRPPKKQVMSTSLLPAKVVAAGTVLPVKRRGPARRER